MEEDIHGITRDLGSCLDLSLLHILRSVHDCEKCPRLLMIVDLIFGRLKPSDI